MPLTPPKTASERNKILPKTPWHHYTESFKAWTKDSASSPQLHDTETASDRERERERPQHQDIETAKRLYQYEEETEKSDSGRKDHVSTRKNPQKSPVTRQSPIQKERQCCRKKKKTTPKRKKEKGLVREKVPPLHPPKKKKKGAGVLIRFLLLVWVTRVTCSVATNRNGTPLAV